MHAHRYRLQFDYREDEYVTAETADEAMALRDGGPGAKMPHTITDETIMVEWITRHARTKVVVDTTALEGAG